MISMMSGTRRRKMANKKSKSTPGGAPMHQRQCNGTTSGEKSEAERLFDRIGTGADHALRRPRDPKVDRQLRQLIAEANANGTDCIINLGSGYFRPGEDDEGAFEDYIAAERSRAREILRKASRMQQTFDRRYQ